MADLDEYISRLKEDRVETLRQIARMEAAKAAIPDQADPTARQLRAAVKHLKNIDNSFGRFLNFVGGKP